MTTLEIFGYLSAILMGISLGMIGGGGSILTVPILVYFFQQNAMVATTGSLFFVGITALVGAAISSFRGLVEYKTGVLFALPSFAGVFFARKFILPAIPDSFSVLGQIAISKSLLILVCFSLLMILASRAMIKSGKTPTTEPSKSNRQKGIISIGIKGFLVGCTTGFVGAGGGFLIIPALVLLIGLPMKMAVGTSLAIITANSLFGFSVSLTEINIDWHLLLTIAALGIFGLILGTQISGRFDEANLKKYFGYFVLAVGSLIFSDQLLKLLH